MTGRFPMPDLRAGSVTIVATTQESYRQQTGGPQQVDGWRRDGHRCATVGPCATGRRRVGVRANARRRAVQVGIESKGAEVGDGSRGVDYAAEAVTSVGALDPGRTWRKLAAMRISNRRRF
jgi:hypothetical protein